MASHQATGIRCPKCGSTNVRIEVRPAGTKAVLRNYRTGVKSSWFLPAERKTYRSRRRYQSIFCCTHCGNVWAKGASVPPFLWKGIGIFTLCVLYLGLIGALLSGSAGFFGGLVDLALLIVMTLYALRWARRHIFKTDDSAPNMSASAVPPQRDLPEAGSAVPPQSAVKPRSHTFHPVDLNDRGTDPLFQNAVCLVVQSGRVSASFLQRQLKLGFPRAERLLTALEQAGIIGPPEGGVQPVYMAPEALPAYIAQCQAQAKGAVHSTPSAFSGDCPEAPSGGSANAKK